LTTKSFTIPEFYMFPRSLLKTPKSADSLSFIWSLHYCQDLQQLLSRCRPQPPDCLLRGRPRWSERHWRCSKGRERSIDRKEAQDPFRSREQSPVKPMGRKVLIGMHLRRTSNHLEMVRGMSLQQWKVCVLHIPKKGKRLSLSSR
jgi:hypothetical protein